ncbi:TPA: type I toxin-antitoxin system Fst family toxin [Staphylococcus aureus]
MSIRRREEVRFMNEILFHIMTTAISGCLVTLFGY